ncbi:NUDIX hydrolase [Haloimpatiens sp. FM7330]|uniref:NUDIX hydrolase n=1 Tax=Haloimpatiens sp. FM7330 TaxID=3298610 RepID=UPI003637A9DE
MELYEKTIDEKQIYKGKIIDVRLQEVKLPNGKKSKREIVKHPGGVAIVAFKDENTILMVEQFRKPIDECILEIPAGKIEKGEEIEVCAKRELEEETGYKSDNMSYLGKVVTSPGFCNEYIYIFKAENLYKGIIGGDEDEFINLHEMKIDKMKDMIKNKEIVDAKTICALMML